MIRVISIDFQIKDTQSADYIYQSCLHKAFNDFHFTVLCSKTFFELDSKLFRNILEPIKSRTVHPLKKLITYLKNIKTIWKEIEESFLQKGETILLFQSFFTSELIILLLLIIKFLLKNPKHVLKNVLICRFELDWKQQLIIRMIKMMSIGKVKLFLFSDTEELCQKHLFDLGIMECFLLPIPHTADLKPNNPNNNGYVLRLGFPGMPRAEKGSSIVLNMAELVHEKASIEVSLQDWSFYKALFEHKNLYVDISFPKETREDYVNYLNKCDIVVLPYSSNNYLKRSSGIFVEAICAGKVVIAPKGTWMSEQLSDMNLGRFAISFNKLSDEFFSLILEVEGDIEYFKKLFESNSRRFREFHSQDNFDLIIKNILCE